jgi:hypothetical protein
VGLPPDRAPRDDDWTWLNALAGHPEPQTEKRMLRETQLLAKALKDAMAGMEPPWDPLMSAARRKKMEDFDSQQDDVAYRFQASSSLSAEDFDELSSRSEMLPFDPSSDLSERIGSRAFAVFSRDSSDDDSIYPEPTGNGFAKLKRRLQDAGLL